jgi:hypothetical protein
MPVTPRRPDKAGHLEVVGVQRAILRGIRYVALSPDGVGAGMMIPGKGSVGDGAHIDHDSIGSTKVPTGTVVAAAPPVVHPVTPPQAQDEPRANVR